MNNTDTSDNMDGIAIIGLSARFPGAENIYQFWENLTDGIESITEFSDEELVKAGIDKKLLSDPKYVKRGAIIKDADKFDADFFGYSPREAEFMDPQQRLFLQSAWHALEDAGCNPEKYPGSIGVYAGSSMNYYLIKNLLFSKYKNTLGDFQTLIGNDKDFLTTRVSYKLNLTGPSLCVQTGCSTSLVAVQLACQSLLNYQCDIALAGGTSLKVPQQAGYKFQEGTILSPDGHCRAFDENAGGTTLGEGVGTVVLKRLEDAISDNDNIYAVIKGAAVNNDGSFKAGYTAPSVNGQKEVILMAQALADVEADSISYIETHGTGTILGDPIEVSALTKAFEESTDKKQFCAIGSVKTNIGHLDAAAGVAGLIKTALALKFKKIPPSLNFTKGNPQCNFEKSPFFVNDKLTDWAKSSTPRRAAVSSFGIGGTNAHIIMEEAPEVNNANPTKTWEILPISAKTETALIRNTQQIASFIEAHPEIYLGNLAYTLQNGRKHFNFRQIVVIDKNENTSTALKFNNNRENINNLDEKSNPSMAFMFSGQGTQYLNMTEELYKNEKVFKSNMDLCSEILLKTLGKDIRNILYPENSEKEKSRELINQTEFAQPILFSVEYSMVQYLKSLGIEPASMIGHSLGEYIAACISGVFSLEDALHIISKRGQLMQNTDEGAMLSISLSSDEVAPYISKNISLAVINSPTHCVLAGTVEELNNLKNKLEKENIKCKLLHNNRGFHSFLMDPVIEKFQKEISKFDLKSPKIPFISNVSGTWITEKDAMDPGYWASHIKSTVQFSTGIKELLKNEDHIFLEVGPGSTLCFLAFLNQMDGKINKAFSTIKEPKSNNSDVTLLYTAIGSLWLNGIDIKWENLYPGENRKKISLPGYSFEKNCYWINPDNNLLIEKDYSVQLSKKDPTVVEKSQPNEVIIESYEQLEDRVAEIWSKILGINEIKRDENFFILGGNSVLATQLISEINNSLKTDVSLRYIFLHPTIREFSTSIENEIKKIILGNINKEEHQTFPILFPVQPKGNRPPLFLVAGAHENRYFNLKKFKSSYEEDFLRYLGSLIPHLGMDQPVYGFRPRGLVAWEKPHRSVEEMAKAYIEEMRKFQPEGPYLIGGECVGGIVAYEMAQQLRKQGQKVSKLILMDTGRPTLSFSLNEKFIFIRRKSKRYILNLFKYLKKKSIKEFIKKLISDIKIFCVILFPITKNMREQKRVRTESFTYQKRLMRYRADVYDGTIFHIINATWHTKNPFLGWVGKYQKPFKFRIVPGDHITRLTTFGNVTGKYLREAIDEIYENDEK